MFEDDDELNALVDENDQSEEEMIFLAHEFLKEKKLLPKFREHVRKHTMKNESETSEEEDDDLDDDMDEDEEEGETPDEE